MSDQDETQGLNIELVPGDEEIVPEIVIPTGMLDAAVQVEEADDRRSYLGGSDAAAAIGASRYKDPYTLWEEKTGRVRPKDLSKVERVYWGKVLESIAAQEWATRKGERIRRVPQLMHHKKMPWMAAHPDRIILGKPAGLEVKTTGQLDEEWGDPGSAQIPREYYVQVQHYIEVTMRDYWEVTVLAGGQGTGFHAVDYTVPRDEEFIRNMLELEADFWRHVELNEPPDPETSAQANRRWPRAMMAEVQASEEIAHVVSILAELKAAEKLNKTRQEQAELLIKAFMQEGETLMLGNTPLLSWKESKGYHVDGYDVAPSRKMRLLKGGKE